MRDVVRAYDMLLERGNPGEVYNIASGRGVRLSEIIEEIGRQVGVRVTSRVNPEFVRPDDNRVIIGSPEKIGRELDWKAEIPLEKTIADMITCMNCSDTGIRIKINRKFRKGEHATWQESAYHRYHRAGRKLSGGISAGEGI